MGLFRRQMRSSGLCRIDNCNNSERSSRRFIKTNEAPYQSIGRRTFAATLGLKELTSGYFWLSVLSESLACYIYVFIVCATRISWTGTKIGHEPNLIAMALSSGACMTLLMLVFRTVHVNPALTIAFLFTGRIPVIRALVYVLVQCISSVAAIALLYSISVEGHAGALGLDNPHPLLESWQILVIEFVISFVVTMATYTTCSYSSYTNARQYILEQVGLNCHDILDLKSSSCDSEDLAGQHEVTNSHRHQNNGGGLLVNSATVRHQHQPMASTLASSLAPRRPIASSNFRVHPHSKGYMSDTYENSDFEYEYDNHRIYTHQQSSPELSPNGARVPPIEELMQDESQLLAPNGFSFLMTPCQSLIIGLAYAMASLTGIPATGASLNPARSFGPAFFMNRWENQWIYWIGPIFGALVAGFLYEFVFNPTRPSSLCYLPKLFRLSAHDMAKVGSKSRMFDTARKPTLPKPDAISIFPSTFQNRSVAQPFQNSTIHNSPKSRQHAATNLISNTTLLNPSIRDSKHQQLIAQSASLAHLQQNHLNGNNFDPLSYIQAQQQRQQHHNQAQHDSSNFDHRSKSTAIMNLIASKHQQSTINMLGRNNFHSVSSSNGSASQDFGNISNADCAPRDLYDNQPGRERLATVISQQISGPQRTARNCEGPAALLCSPLARAAGTSTTLGALSQFQVNRQRPASLMTSSPFDTTLARKRRPAALNPTATSAGRTAQDGHLLAQTRTTSAVRPFQHQHQQPPAPHYQFRSARRLEPEDENFYQTPNSELDEKEEFERERAQDLSSSRCKPQGGSTGEGSQSNSSGTTNETSSTRTTGPAELVVSAELLAGQIQAGSAEDYYDQNVL